jgi:hypothetical protein
MAHTAGTEWVAAGGKSVSEDSRVGARDRRVRIRLMDKLA